MHFVAKSKATLVLEAVPQKRRSEVPMEEVDQSKKIKDAFDERMKKRMKIHSQLYSCHDQH